MPLTAFDRQRDLELDVDQVLAYLRGTPDAGPDEERALPEAWRTYIRTNLACPVCGVLGAEVVRQARSPRSGKALRQSFFRYSANSGGEGHHKLCDFANGDEAAVRLDHMVDFGAPKTALTKLVRNLVCRGIALKVFDQSTIRNMRTWFFETRVSAQVSVDLDPRAPEWAFKVRELSNHRWLYGDEDAFTLTPAIVRMPGFRLDELVAKRLAEANKGLLTYIHDHRLWRVFADVSLARRAGKLAQKYTRQQVLDPERLRVQYEASVRLARFVAVNFAPLQHITGAGRKYYWPEGPFLALCALLLFNTQWNEDDALAQFASIVNAEVEAPQDLGNVMGLNPFHDYDAWQMIFALQRLAPFATSDYDALADQARAKADVVAQWGAA